MLVIPRKILPEIKKELASDKAIVITGMRRVGKTTLIRSLYDQVTDRRKVYLDLENPLNQTYFEELNYEQIRLHLERLTEGKGSRLIIFLDEIQLVKNIPSVVKYLSDHYLIKFVLTGSASFYLKNLFTESLAGRKRIFELFPLSFEEFLRFKHSRFSKPGWEENISQATFYLYNQYFSEYLAYGGFPSVVLKSVHQEKIIEIEEIYKSYFQKEVQTFSDFRKISVMRDLMRLLGERVGSKIDVTKLAGELGVTRVTIQEYLDFLQGTYFLHRISPYSRNLDVSLRGQTKPYLCDNGLLTQLGISAPGALLENTVYNLIKDMGEVFYYQSKGGAEIDFIVTTPKGKIAFEVKTQVFQTDINRLREQAQRLGLKRFFVVCAKFSNLPQVIFPFQL